MQSTGPSFMSDAVLAAGRVNKGKVVAGFEFLAEVAC